VNGPWYTKLAMVFAIWFALTSWLWTYLMNIFISYPFGVAALLLFLKERKRDPQNILNNRVLLVLIAGWIISIVAAVVIK